MNKDNFTNFTDMMERHLDAKKNYKINKERFNMMQNMFNIAKHLFADMDITLEDDPLQLGRMSLCIKGYDITVCGEADIKLFAELIFNADNFEIYANEDEKVEFNIMYNDIVNVTIE